jgi:hypothetical protein
MSREKLIAGQRFAGTKEGSGKPPLDAFDL